MANKMKGGDVIARMLKEEGVDTVFGIIDGTYFGLYASLQSYDIKLITPRHETSALHMAGAYARLTGKLGVCIASNGPGVANALPGVAVENAEGNRVLLITSGRRVGITYPDRGGTYQNFDQTAVIRAMSKWSESAQSFDRIQELARTAFRQCWIGRPGVVNLEVPENLMNGEYVPGEFWEAGTYGSRVGVYARPEEVVRAAHMLVHADYPIIHAGSGVIHAQAYEELKKVAELLHAPVVTSWGARGVMPEDHELALSMVYVKLNNETRNAGDVVLTLGSRLGETDWWGKAPYWSRRKRQKMIQVDIDPNVPGANKPADLPVQADVKVFLSELARELEDKKSGMNISERKKRVAALNEKIDAARKKLDEHLADQSAPLGSAHVPVECQKVFADDSILVVDGGNTAIWSNFFHEIRVPGTVISTPKMGMLGAGVGQALGAAAAFPERQVYCIIGDGAMGFHPQEVETAIRNNLNVIFLVLCDKQWGMVKMNQQFALRPIKTMIKKSLGPDETINADLGEIDWRMMAESMGAHGERVSAPDEIGPALERSRKSGRCTVIHVDVDPVRHMWAPSLLDFKAMHEEPKG